MADTGKITYNIETKMVISDELSWAELTELAGK